MSKIDEIESELRDLIGDEKFEELKSIVEKRVDKEAEKLNDQFNELMQNINTLAKSISNLMTDVKEVVGIAKVGVVISVNAFGDSQIIGMLGNKNGIEKAIEDVKHNYEETTLNDKAVSKGSKGGENEREELKADS